MQEMMLEKTRKDIVYTPKQIEEILKPVFDSYGINKAVLFGSYAKGTACKKSDIDLLVDSGLRGFTFFGFLDDVVNSLGKKVDIIDITEIVPGSDFEKDIKMTGVVIYGR